MGIQQSIRTKENNPRHQAKISVSSSHPLLSISDIVLSASLYRMLGVAIAASARSVKKLASLNLSLSFIFSTGIFFNIIIFSYSLLLENIDSCSPLIITLLKR
ncbi:hypothetical protein AWENTII_006570 [Aspergillus wentii]